MKRSKNFYLFRIWSLLNGGKTLKEVQDEMTFSKQKLNYYMKDLKTLSYVKKVGYGVWKIGKKYDEKEVKKYIKEVKKTTVIGNDQRQEVKKIKEVRGHAFQIKLLLPERYRNWDKRGKLFEIIGLETEKLYVGGVERGQQLTINNTKVHLYNKSIVVNMDESYLFKTAKESKSYALLDFFKVIKKLERIFNGSPLSHVGKYKFKVTRQHYAIIKNALARQYINEEKKLECYTGKGLWLLVDNSFKLEELETVHAETSDEDNEKVQNVFNNIKKEDLETLKDMTHGNIKEYLTEISKGLKQSVDLTKENSDQLGFFAENQVAHVRLIEKIDKKLGEQTDVLIKMGEVLERIR